MDGLRLLEVNATLQKLLQDEDYSESLIKRIAQSGSIQHLDKIPEQCYIVATG